MNGTAIESQIIAADFDYAFNAALVDGLVDILDGKVFITRRGHRYLAKKSPGCEPGQGWKGG